MMAVKRDPLLVIDIGGTTVKYGAPPLTVEPDSVSQRQSPAVLKSLRQLIPVVDSTQQTD